MPILTGIYNIQKNVLFLIESIALIRAEGSILDAADAMARGDIVIVMAYRLRVRPSETHAGHRGKVRGSSQRGGKIRDHDPGRHTGEHLRDGPSTIGTDEVPSSVSLMPTPDGQ